MLSPSQPQDPSSIPHAASYVVGRDAQGHWLAVETHGLGGGLFTSREAAFRYASFETDRRAGAVAVVAEPVTLRL